MSIIYKSFVMLLFLASHLYLLPFFLRLVWTDARLQKLQIYELSSKVLQSIDLSEHSSTHPVYGVAVDHSHTAYISVWGSTSMLSVDIRQAHTEVKVIQHSLGSDVLFSVAVKKNSISTGKISEMLSPT